jgi:PPOX class probable F420-dependent enzyme
MTDFYKNAADADRSVRRRVPHLRRNHMTPLPPDVRALFDAPNFAHVATLMPDGSPHSVPMWVGLEGEHITFLSSPNSVKARNLGRDPRVCLSIVDHARPTTMAQVRGRVAEVLDGDDGWAGIDRIAQKYIGAPYPLRSDRVLFMVAADRAWAQAFG